MPKCDFNKVAKLGRRNKSDFGFELKYLRFYQIY